MHPGGIVKYHELNTKYTLKELYDLAEMLSIKTAIDSILEENK